MLLTAKPQGFCTHFLHGEEKATTEGPAFENTSLRDVKWEESTKEANLLWSCARGKTWVCLEVPTTPSSEGQWLCSVRPTILSCPPLPKLFLVT